jgi:hypothetical protein
LGGKGKAWTAFYNHRDLRDKAGKEANVPQSFKHMGDFYLQADRTMLSGMVMTKVGKNKNLRKNRGKYQKYR